MELGRIRSRFNQLRPLNSTFLRATDLVHITVHDRLHRAAAKWGIMPAKIGYRGLANSATLPAQFPWTGFLRTPMAPHNRRPPIRYAILFPGRTGSTYLTDHLGNHPNIVANYEILSQYQESWEQQLGFLNELVFTRRSQQVTAIGFKTKVKDVHDLDAFLSYLQTHEFRIIHLTRTNQLKFVVSIVRANMLRQRTGTSNLIFHDQHPLGPTAIPVADFAKARKRLRRQMRLERIVKRLQLPTLKMVYEDLLENEQAELNRAFEFLGVRPASTSGKTLKNTPQDIRSAVTNLDEIIDHFPDMAPFVDQL